MSLVAVTRSSSGGVAIRLCTSGFVDDVMFAHNGLCGAGDANTAQVQTYSPDGSVDLTPRPIVKLSFQEAAADQAAVDRDGDRCL